MEISSVSGQSSAVQQTTGTRANMRQAFKDLDSALQSGDLDAAKKAFAQIQQNAPKNASGKSNPMQAKMDALGKALDAGDLQAARTAYADVKTAMAQRPAGGHGGHGGHPAGGGSAASSSSSTSSSSSVTYDPRDTNKDGKVSAEEALVYSIAHPSTTEGDTTATTQSGLDALA